MQQLIDDANQTLEEAGGCSHEVVVVILHRDTAGGSVGITLAGGADYEAKEITVSVKESAVSVEHTYTHNSMDVYSQKSIKPHLLWLSTFSWLWLLHLSTNSGI